MSDVVIRAAGLGKKYLIGHETAERYTTLRDVLARSGRRFARSAFDMVRGRPIIVGDEVEEFWALRDINFEVRRGDVVGIIGRNGAGKSTLLKILSRITDPSAGRVEIRGRVASLLEVGTGFHPELTGRENIYLNGAVLGMARSEIKCKFDEIVDFSGIEKFLDTPVKRFSSGMYVRLAFAVAAHLEPEILIVDEVLAVGDAEFQKKCLGKMGQFAEGGRTVLFVSHNMGSVRSLCTSAILLEEGKLLCRDDAKELTLRYISSASNLSSGKTRHVAGTLAAALEIRHVEVVQNNKSVYAVLPDKPFCIRVSGVVKLPLRRLELGVNAFVDGVQVFSCFDTPEATPLMPGPFVSEFAIPRYQLRPGCYELSVGAYQNGGSEWLWIESAQAFHIVEEWDGVVKQRDEGLALVRYEASRTPGKCS